MRDKRCCCYALGPYKPVAGSQITSIDMHMLCCQASNCYLEPWIQFPQQAVVRTPNGTGQQQG